MIPITLPIPGAIYSVNVWRDFSFNDPHALPVYSAHVHGAVCAEQARQVGAKRAFRKIGVECARFRTRLIAANN